MLTPKDYNDMYHQNQNPENTLLRWMQIRRVFCGGGGGGRVYWWVTFAAWLANLQYTENEAIIDAFAFWIQNLKRFQLHELTPWRRDPWLIDLAGIGKRLHSPVQTPVICLRSTISSFVSNPHFWPGVALASGIAGLLFVPGGMGGTRIFELVRSREEASRRA